MTSTLKNRLMTTLLAVLCFATGFAPTAFADDKAATPPAPPAATAGSASKGPEEADIAKIKEKYWARGNEAEIGVVQNRIYSSKKKFEFGLLVGSVSSDPFLNNTSLTFSAGYHFSELLSVHLGFSKNFVGPSAALTQLEAKTGTTAATNMQRYWLTADTRWSMIYGKVSLFGSSILYFDAYLSAGAGLVSTESGSNFAIMPGIGQICHINKTIGINIHYKFFWYKEQILSKTALTLGQPLGENVNFGGTIMVGITLTLDPTSSKDDPSKMPVKMTP